MLHLREGLSPIEQTTYGQDTISETDFELSGTGNNKEYGDFDDNEIEFQVHTGVEDCLYPNSPPLWKTNKNSKKEVQPLLPHNHKFNNLSLSTRTQVILNARRELEEMIQKMPESSYELSLTDLVDPEIKFNAKEEVATAKPGLILDMKMEVERERQKKKRNRKLKRSRPSRIDSFDSSASLLKMFFPAFLLMKKKSTNGKLSEDISWSSSVEGWSFKGSKRYIDKEWWKKGLLIAGEKKNSGENNNTTSSTIDNQTSRHDDIPPGCWRFIHSKESKTWRQGRCLFQ